MTDHGDAVRAITGNLARLVDLLADRDRTIRALARHVDRSTAAVAGQRRDLADTLDAVAELSAITTRFVRENRDVMGTDLAHAVELTRIVRKRQASLAEAWDTMPTLAQNLAQAYDFKRKRLRVQFSLAAGPFSSVFRAQLCAIFGIPLCSTLFHADGSGALDPLLDTLFGLIPGNLP